MKTSNIALIMVLCLIFVMLGFVVSADTAATLNITKLPFENSTNITLYNLTNQTNYTITLQCMSAGNGTLTINSGSTCLFTSINQTFLNFTNNESKNITINASIPAKTQAGIYNETIYAIYNNETVGNGSIIYNIQPPNASVVDVNPSNGSFLGQDDNIPSTILVNLSEGVDINASTFNLKHDDNNINWYSVQKNNQSVEILLDKVPDGAYSGRWSLVSNNITQVYNYEYRVQTTEPPSPKSIKPTGSFIYQDATLRVEMPDNSNYTIYYTVTDGFPQVGSNWRALSFNNGVYRQNINFESLGVGQVYLRIEDQYGNYKISPTRIVSGPGFKMDVNELSKTAEPGDRIKYDIDMTIKAGSGSRLSCILEDFKTSYNDGSSNWNTRGLAFLQKSNYNGNPERRMKLSSDFEDTLRVTPATTEELELVVNVPFEIESGIDYSSDLKCIIS